MKIRVSHILVQHLYEAEDILSMLKNGKSFSELARKYSQCSSAKNGGDLGEVKVSSLDEDFSEAALALKVGTMSARPVRTRFGYHLIFRSQ